jgi:putative endonuclease
VAKHNVIGKIGEDIAEKWLIQKGFTIIERNYLKKWGEIDIVARGTGGKVHFVEVKSVSYETKAHLEHAVSHETWRPEENVHREKIRRMKNAIQTWVLENKYKGEFNIDILTVRIVQHEKFAQVNMLGSVIFE